MTCTLIIVRWHIGAWSVQLAVQPSSSDVFAGVVRGPAVRSGPVLRQGRRRAAVERRHRDLETLHRSRHARSKHRRWRKGEPVAVASIHNSASAACRGAATALHCSTLPCVRIVVMYYRALFICTYCRFMSVILPSCRPWCSAGLTASMFTDIMCFWPVHFPLFNHDSCFLSSATCSAEFASVFLGHSVRAIIPKRSRLELGYHLPLIGHHSFIAGVW